MRQIVLEIKYGEKCEEIGFPCTEQDLQVAMKDLDVRENYLIDRAEKESNPKVKALLKKDAVFLDSVQAELTSARRFMIVVRCKNMKDAQVFDYANRVRKITCDQGFDAHRMTKAEIKRFLALYFDASLYGEQMPDEDGADNFARNSQ